MSRTIELDWTAPANVDHYTIQYCASSGAPCTPNLPFTPNPPNRNPAIIGHLTNGTLYYLRVVATLADGSRLISNTVSARPEPDCFPSSSMAMTRFPVYEATSLPYSPTTGLSATSGAYPASRFDVPIPAGATGLPNVRGYTLVWANACTDMSAGITPPLPEPPAAYCTDSKQTLGNDDYGVIGPSARSVGFSSYDRANECTMLQSFRQLGYSVDTITRMAEAGGYATSLVLVPDKVPNKAGTLVANDLRALGRTVKLRTGALRELLVDTCIYAAAPKPGSDGIWLDYEVADGRTPTAAFSFISSLVNAIHVRFSKQLLFNTDPLASATPTTGAPLLGSSAASGIDSSNAYRVLEAVDMYMIPLTTGAGLAGGPHPGHPSSMPVWTNYLNTIELLSQRRTLPVTADLRAKLVFGVGSFATTVADAAQLGEEFENRHYGGVALLPEFVAQGGACQRTFPGPDGTPIQINQAIACLTLGPASGGCNGTYAP